MSKKQIITLADACVQCGLCLPHCPTYAVQKKEGHSPRGRIALIRAYAEGTLLDEPAWAGQVDTCLSCGQCEEACPAGVQYQKIVELARAERSQRRRPYAEHAFNLLLKQPWLNVIAGRLARYIRIQPFGQITPAKELHTYYNIDNARGKVSLLADCAANTFQKNTLHAAALVLNKLGFSVVLQKPKGCCGGWWSHTGQAKRAQESLSWLSKKRTNEMMPLLTITSGCHQYLARKADFKVQDIYSFIDEHWPEEIELTPVKIDIQVHLPCTQSSEAYIRLLERIPGVQLMRLPSGCCGAGGAMALSYPDYAAQIMPESLKKALKSDATVVTCNQSCQSHMKTMTPNSKTEQPIFILSEALKCFK